MSSKDVESMGTTVYHSNKCVYVYLSCLTCALVFTWLGGAAMYVCVFPPVSGSNSYKSGHFAYVRATQAEVGNRTMEFEGIEFGRSFSIGSNFNYSESQHRLKVLSEGNYFIYMKLRFERITMGSGTIKVTLSSGTVELLSCEVSLPENENTVSKTCWDVVPHLKSDSNLIANMIVHGSHTKDSEFGWKLVVNESGFGMYLIDSP